MRRDRDAGRGAAGPGRAGPRRPARPLLRGALGRRARACRRRVRVPRLARDGGGLRPARQPRPTRARSARLRLETLAIVAYLGPVSRPEVARIRGVAADSAVAGLLERGLIEESGRGETAGQPVLYTTTTLFERHVRARGGAREPAVASASSICPRPITRPCGRGCTSWPTRVPVRVNRYLASTGLGSRRAVEQLIRAGRVTVNGDVADLATRVDEGDDVRVDGEPVRPEAVVAVVLNKPRGVVTTAHDPQGRPTVIGLVETDARLFPGRPPRSRHDGRPAPHQRRRPGRPADAPSPRRPEVVPCACEGGARGMTRSTACGPASSSTTGRRRPPTSEAAGRASSTSRSTRVETARCGGCAPRSGIR